MLEEFKEKNTSHWRIYTLSVIGALLIIGIVWLINSDFGYKNNTGNFQSPSSNIVTPTIIQSSPGEVVEGFPKELTLNSKTEITQSYSATYPNSSVKQETVIFTSSKDIKTNYNFYLDWSKQNNWSVINSSEEDKVSSLYLRKGLEDINITITAAQITISHINK